MDPARGEPGHSGTDKSPGQHLVVYDGICGLCDRLIRFVVSRDRRRTFRFASLQGIVGRQVIAAAGGEPDDMTTFYVVADYQTPRARLLARSRAALFVVKALGWPWSCLTVLRMMPEAILDRVYDVVARHRYRWFGRHDACLLPPADVRDRFLD
jgi:predicted DCC family thiol-disulfide oxidoreductase YuxK